MEKLSKSLYIQERCDGTLLRTTERILEAKTPQEIEAILESLIKEIWYLAKDMA